MKICTKCKMEKPVTEFYKHRGTCKECYRTQANINSKKNVERRRQYYLSNKEKILEKRKQYVMDSQELRKEWYKKYSLIHKDELIRKSREYYHNHKDKCRERARQYRIRNGDKINEISRLYRSNHKNEIKKKNSLYRLTHQEQLQLLQQKLHKKYIRELGDCYIKQILTQKSILSYADIPKELIELKRLQIKIKRLLNEKPDKNTC